MVLASSLSVTSCANHALKTNNSEPIAEEKTSVIENNIVDRFADMQILRYDIEGFDKLTLQQKTLVYYLSEAGLAGRDIIYDQNNRYNLEIRKALEGIISKYAGDKQSSDWNELLTYAKRVWVSNGIHHHYGMEKFKANFSKKYFDEVLAATNTSISAEAYATIFDANYAKRKVKGSNIDMIVASANNFYGDGVTQKMVEDFYDAKSDIHSKTPIELGLNSTLVLKDGVLVEEVWKSGGKYGEAIDQIIFWLKKAVTVAENTKQAKALEKLIEFYQTGDLNIWDEYNILWVNSTEGDIDWINGFIEVYGDALAKRANYESMVQITDFAASKQMEVIAQNAQWFEDNSPLMPEHKKQNVKGITYKVVQVASESGDSNPTTPIGVNLPNNEWIRETHGSKSVSLGNITTAYEKVGGSGLTKEFAFDQAEIDRSSKHGALASKLHTALHEVIGHASGQINPGVGQPSSTLKNYTSTLEEARADLVALYYLYDQKLVDLKLISSLDVGKAEYDSYIRNGLMTQLQRLDLGNHLEEEHMQNRQLVASWVFERGSKNGAIEKVKRDGKTFYHILDYSKMRILFGELLQEIQRIKSEGDYDAASKLVEGYGVKVDRSIHEEVLARVKPLDLAPYNGFVNIVLQPKLDEQGAILDIQVIDYQNFVEQMLYYGQKYSFLK